jgi:hypothetical protein
MNKSENDHKVTTSNLTKKQLHMAKVNVIRRARTLGKKQFITALKFNGYIDSLIEGNKNVNTINQLKLIKAKLESIEDHILLRLGVINTYRTNKILALFNTSLNQTVVMTIKASKKTSTITCSEVLDIIKKDKDTYELILNSFIKMNEIKNILIVINNLKKIDVHHEYTADLVKYRIKEMELLGKALTE